ncbi:sensor histidine kinase [Planobispora siamensis]|uniref:histidine kinase n=1 Tax=Planobispora siamensis TaxID=936338 RepID=A0A8J3SGQ1_9ACTN|nr:histidine kinase [Planobispora siamensis]GIH94241.1 hypothetical protein Psi01_48710 [Planobispora siamensis]
MSASAGTEPSPRVLAVHGALIVVIATACFWLGSAHSPLPAPALLSEIAVGVCFAAAGLAAWRLRPRSRTGVWMLALGYVVSIHNPYGFRLPDDLPGHPLLVVAGGVTLWLQYAMAGHVLMAYPSGRLTDRAGRALVACGYLLAVAGSVLLLTTRVPDRPACMPACYESPVRLVGDRQLYLHLKAVITVAWVLLAIVALAVLVRRAARSGPRQRRVLGFATGVSGVSVALFTVFGLIVTTGSPRSPLGAFFHYGHHWGAVIALPVPFFFGLLRERLAFASVGALVGRLEHASADTVESALRETLRDPTLRVAFPLADGLVDGNGRPYDPGSDGGRSLTPLGDPPVAVLVHDPDLEEHRELLDAAAVAARLALDNARLHAQVRAQLAEVQASRQRITTAADAERQRLERDLHDGAQQRLLGVGLTLGVLRGRLTSPAERELVGELERELRSAIWELRELAQGIRPAVLTDQGLAPALAALARRSGTRVGVDVRVGRRLDPVIEATAYYLVSEALQNVTKHARGAGARVSASLDGERLTVEVADDGPGGASVRAGAGLRGLLDRVEAVGGQLEISSPPGRGTTLRAELPCA